MGSNATKFYKNKANPNVHALSLRDDVSKIDLTYADNDFSSTVIDGCKTWFSLDNTELKPAVVTHSFRYEGMTPNDVTETVVRQRVLAGIAEKIANTGWSYVGRVVLGGSSVQLFAKSDGDQNPGGDSLNISLEGGNKILISSGNETAVEFFEKGLLQLSSRKGIKETEKFEDEAPNGEKIHTAKMTLRHQPWSLEEFDWWGGSYLLSKMIKGQLAETGRFSFGDEMSRSIDTIDNRNTDNQQICVIGLCRDRVKFRRVSAKASSRFVQGLLDGNLIDEEFEQEKMGFTVKFRSTDPWRAGSGAQIASLLFTTMNATGHVYLGSFRGQSGGGSSLIFARSEPYDDKVEFLDITTVCLSGESSLHFAPTFDEGKATQIGGNLGSKWYKGLKANGSGHEVIFKGSPWFDVVYGSALLCDLVDAMASEGWSFFGSTTAGVGEILLFGVKE